jgi:endonuclease/exonuclease/phosphatase family metal-dependent hydrolase
MNVWAIPLVSDELGERMRRLPAALRAFDPDVICLQEAWDPIWRGRIERALAPEYASAGSASGGLLLLSRLPILEEGFTPFPPFPGLGLAERMAGKGILQARVKTGEGEVRIVTAHLALAFGADNPRTRQLRWLLEHMEAWRDLPLIVAADLNTPPAREGAWFPDYGEILDRGFVSAHPPVLREDGRWDPGPPTRVGWPRPRRVTRGFWPDHVLFRDGATGALRVVAFRIELDEPDTALSDHNLLLADLALDPKR